MFCSNQLDNGRQMDLFGPSIDVKLKEKKEKDGKIVGLTSYHCNSIDFMFEKSKAKEGPSDGQLVC